MEIYHVQREHGPVIIAKGNMDMADNALLLEEIRRIFSPGFAFLVVVCEQDVVLDQTSTENHGLQNKAASFFRIARGGSLAMVGKNDMMFGVCRQFQSMAQGTKVRMAVFRGEQEAAEWTLRMRQEAG